MRGCRSQGTVIRARVTVWESCSSTGGHAARARRCARHDPGAAAALFEQAARDGLAEAQYALGALFQGGSGVSRNLGEAARLYGLAAAQNHAGAQNSLGILYANGEGVERDTVWAQTWFTLAGLNGEPRAAVNGPRLAGVMAPGEIAQARARVDAFLLAPAPERILLVFGAGPPPPVVGVSPAAHARAESAIIAAAGVLGIALAPAVLPPELPGVAEVPPPAAAEDIGPAGGAVLIPADADAALRELLPRATAGDARARYSLAVRFLYGRDVEADPIAAVGLLALAADQGLADAQFALATLYGRGTVLKRDPNEALRLYRLAAAQDHAAAENEL